jgi:hypothetical protein
VSTKASRREGRRSMRNTSVVIVRGCRTAARADAKGGVARCAAYNVQGTRPAPGRAPFGA